MTNLDVFDEDAIDSGYAGQGQESVLHARAQVKHLLKVACALSRAEAAVVVIVRNGTSSVLASVGANTENATFRWPDDYKPYHPDRTHVISEVADLQLARAVRAILGTYKTGMLVRVPISLETDYTLALLLHAESPTPLPNKSELAVLKSIARGLEAELTDIVHDVLKSSEVTTIPLTSLELAAEVHADKGMRILLDNQLNLVALSAMAVAALLPESQTMETNQPHLLSNTFPSSISHLFKRTLESGVSSPEVEVVVRAGGVKKVVNVRASPVRPLASEFGLLDVIVRDSVSGDAPSLVSELSIENAKIAAGAAGTFLIDTLVRKRSIKDVDSVGYITVRAWRSSLKKHQIAALRAVKQHDPDALAAYAGRECAAEISSLVGPKVFKYVVPVPGGHDDPDKSLAAAIARVIGSDLGLPVVFAFANHDGQTTGPQKKGARRSKMRLIQQVPGPAIIINDVASSGASLAEAQKILNEAGTDAFAMAWIGGEVS